MPGFGIPPSIQALDSSPRFKPSIQALDSGSEFKPSIRIPDPGKGRQSPSQSLGGNEGVRTGISHPGDEVLSGRTSRSECRTRHLHIRSAIAYAAALPWVDPWRRRGSPTPIPNVASRPASPPSMPATTQSFPCAVRQTATGVGVFATHDIIEGGIVLEINGTIQQHPTRYSIQISLNEHIECHEVLSVDEMRARFPWRFLNHCCEPNAAIVGRTLVARRLIRAGEQVTFDYTTTEAAMAEPFRCGCGAERCLGEVRGFLALSPAEQRARAEIVAPHIKSFLPKTNA